MSDFRMPSLGADMEAGTLVQWLKHPGDTLKRGDIIAVVDTQKGAIEIEVFEDGVLEETLIAPGHEVPVGTVLARIRTTGDTAAPQASTQAAAPAPSRRERTPGARTAASPAARALAADLHVDLAGSPALARAARSRATMCSGPHTALDRRRRRPAQRNGWAACARRSPRP